MTMSPRPSMEKWPLLDYLLKKVVKLIFSPFFSPVVRRREDQLAGQREARRVPRHVAPQVELARHRPHRVVRRPRRHLRVGSRG